MAKNRLITSALPYVNNVPHLGNIIGCVLSADVFARYCRSAGYNTLYVCGTDEHGTATEAKAIEEGLSPKEICDKYYAIHKKIYDWFNIKFDCFGRTSTEVHKELTQDLFKKLQANGWIVENEVEQMYDPEVKKFLADRFIVGTCPHCKYENARGDQCENCGKLLNAVDLINPKSKLSGASPVVKKSNHMFLALDKMQPEIKEWVSDQQRDGFWTNNAVNITNAWLKEGLKERAITRDLKWGVPVPVKGYENKVFYVWFDAPIGYISITKSCRDDWEFWWKDHSVKLYQFMGKDNIPFHSILFPAIQMGSADKWNMVHHLNSTEFLNYEDGKFSKSLGQGVFGEDAIETGIPADAWRFYLLMNRPETSDSLFSWKQFQERNNNELLANLGNFINRTLTFIKNYLGGKVSKHVDEHFVSACDDRINVIIDLYEKVELREVLQEVLALSKSGNAYFQDNEPWKLVKEDVNRANEILYNCLDLVIKLGVLVEPFMPGVAEEIFKQVNVGELKIADLNKFELGEHSIGKPAPLFRKMEDDEINKWREKFKGKQSERGNDFSKVDLRVAQVKEVSNHPDADKLYVLKIDVGSLGERQLVAGLKAYYKPEELQDKKIVIVSNLKPAKLRGVESQGMLLAGEDKSGKVGLVTVDSAIPGDSVHVDGLETSAKDAIKIDDFFKFKLTTKKGGVLVDGKPLVTSKGKVLCERVADGAKIR